MKYNRHLIALAAGLCAMAAGAVEFRSADVHNSDDYPTVAAVKHMSELLDKRSNGKYKIKVFNKSALGSEKETLDQVKIGALEMNRVNISALNSICPKTLVPTMPFLFDSIAHMRKSLDGPIGEEILKGCEHEGLVGLAFYDSGARSIYAKKPVKTLADAKGLKIRVQQSDLWVALVSAMGANATPIAFAEVYLALQNNTVDAQENPLPTIEAKKFFEVQKNISLTGHIVDSLLTVTSGQLWGKLSADEKKIFTEVMQEAAEKTGRDIIASEARLVEEFKKKGNNVITVDKAAFREAVLKNTKPTDHGYRQQDYDRITAIK